MRILAIISVLLVSYLAGATGSCYVSGCSYCYPDAHTCAYCDAQHWLYNGGCIDCNYQTAWCTICPHNTCVNCDPGFYLTSNNLCNVCYQAIPNCKYCSRNGERCFICDDDSYAYNGVCVNTDPCGVGKYRDTLTTLCADCAISIAYCSKCSNDGIKCYDCDHGFYRKKSYQAGVKDSCEYCGLKFPNCVKCIEDFCISCTLGYHVDSYGYCVPS